MAHGLPITDAFAIRRRKAFSACRGDRWARHCLVAKRVFPHRWASDGSARKSSSGEPGGAFRGAADGLTDDLPEAQNTQESVACKRLRGTA